MPIPILYQPRHRRSTMTNRDKRKPSYRLKNVKYLLLFFSKTDKTAHISCIVMTHHVPNGFNRADIFVFEKRKIYDIWPVDGLPTDTFITNSIVFDSPSIKRRPKIHKKSVRSILSTRSGADKSIMHRFVRAARAHFQYDVINLNQKNVDWTDAIRLFDWKISESRVLCARIVPRTDKWIDRTRKTAIQHLKQTFFVLFFFFSSQL